MIDEVDAISHIQDPTIRNLRITQCYSEISTAIKRVTGGGANWPTFATWASKQAGVTIRKEDLTRKIEAAFDDDPEVAAILHDVSGFLHANYISADRSRLRAIFRKFVTRFLPIERTSDATARGNLKVFAEIGREFARFLETIDSTPTFDQGRIDEFCKDLRDGEPPDGQRLLKSAFGHYFGAIHEPDLPRKQQLLFLANALVGLHEQTRLQPEIAEALNTPVVDPRELQRDILKELGVFGSWWAEMQTMAELIFRGPTPLDRAFQRLTERARKLAHIVITDHLLTIGLANGTVLRLGTDLNAPFPASLQRITNAEALELLSRIDPTPDSTHWAGAIDWADLPDRMHFIVDFFRCYHEEDTLFSAPFNTAQVGALKNGTLPEGRL